VFILPKIFCQMYKVGVGQDSHKFLAEPSDKPCRIGGVVLEGCSGLDADSDGDVVLHALCNAITSIIHVPLLGGLCINLCREGITDSRIYVAKGLEYFKNHEILHVAFSIEGARPRMQGRSKDIRESVAELLQIDVDQVGITFTSGDGLTDFGKGVGLMCYCILTVRKKV
jgi:2-C-methyl-D-erythritol 2,4-cyclodiphosphate synthase